MNFIGGGTNDGTDGPTERRERRVGWHRIREGDGAPVVAANAGAYPRPERVAPAPQTNAFSINQLSRIGTDRLMTLPGATILSIEDGTPRAVNYRDTEHFQLTRDFLNKPERYHRTLFRGRGREKRRRIER